LTQIPKFGIVLVVVLVLGALGFRDRKETAVLQLICSVSMIAKRSGFSRTTTSTRTTPLVKARYLTFTLFRKNVGTSKSCPSIMVGSLFSKRPRETGSNCRVSCFASAFFGAVA
jgi:hypothetical protein